MQRLPSFQDRKSLIRHRIGEETLTEAIVEAFEIIGAEPHERETTLYEWINCDGLEKLDWDVSRPLHVSTVIWGYPTIITAEAVEIYDE